MADGLWLRIANCKALSKNSRFLDNTPKLYGGPGQKSQEYSAFRQITGLGRCKLQAPSATWLAAPAGQPDVQGVIPIFIVDLSMYALF